MSRLSYQYLVLRCVPRPEREEFVNVGVVLYCEAAQFLRVAWQADPARLRALYPDLDVDQVCAGLEYVDAICRADPRAGAAAETPMGQRFGLLKAPRSTVLQPGPVHGGLTEDPAGQLARLVTQLVG